MNEDFVDFLPDNRDGSSFRLIENFFEMVSPIYEAAYFPLFYGIGTLPNLHTPEQSAQWIVDRTSSGGNLVLDVACGTGRVTRKLTDRFEAVYGLDLSGKMMQQAMSRLPLEARDRVSFARANAERLPFEESTFDDVTCSGAIYFFPSVPTVLNEIKRVLKPGGRFAGMTVVERGIFGNPVSRTALKVYNRLGTYNVYGEDELQSIFSGAGFTNFRCDVHGCISIFDARCPS